MQDNKGTGKRSGGLQGSASGGIGWEIRVGRMFTGGQRRFAQVLSVEHFVPDEKPTGKSENGIDFRFITGGQSSMGFPSKIRIKK
jgi:hypothetical protein